MENTGEKWAKQGGEAFTFFSMAPVPNPSFSGTWGPPQSPGQRAGGLCSLVNGGKQQTCASWEGKG